MSLSSILTKSAQPPFFNDPLNFTDYTTGMYYGPSIGFNGSTVTYTTTANRIYCVPFVPQITHTFAKICIFNTGTGNTGDHMRLGIYANSSGLPGALIVDAGVATFGGSAANNTVTISGGQSLTVGTIYWLVGAVDAAIELQAIQADMITEPYLCSQGLPSLRVGYPKNQIYRSFTYAALPDPIGTLYVSSSSADDLPYITLEA